MTCAVIVSADGRSAFFDLDQEMMPLKIIIFDDNTFEELWSCEVNGEGAVNIPGFYPRRVGVRVEAATGEIRVFRADGTTVSLTREADRP